MIKNIPSSLPIRRWIYSQKKINLNWSIVMPWFSFWYSGKFLYFSNSICQAVSLRGGMMPDIGCHSTIERPDRVSLVMPPIITMRKMSIKADISQVVICFCVLVSIYLFCLIRKIRQGKIIQWTVNLLGAYCTYHINNLWYLSHKN